MSQQNDPRHSTSTAGTLPEPTQVPETAVAVVGLETGSSDPNRLVQAVVQVATEAPDSPEAIARRHVEEDPESAKAWEALGSLLLKNGDLVESGHCFEAALRIDPSFLAALNKLTALLHRQGRLAEAEAPYRAALAAAPDNHLVQLNLASVLAALGKHEEVLALVEQLTRAHPKVVRAYLLAVDVETNARRYENALAWVERAIEITPQQAEIRTRRAELLWWMGRSAEALKDCEYVLEVDPSDAKTLHIQGLALQTLDRPAEALVSFRAAERANPETTAAVVADRAWLLAEMGRTDEALAEFDRALELQPEHALARCRRVHLTRGKVADEDLSLMERMADDPARPYTDRLNLNFAIGQVYLKRNDGERAFARLDAGNGMMRECATYDGDAEERRFGRIATLFSKGELDRLMGSGRASNRPIFVFGMPRSGTSLVEQILASHSSAKGAGEISVLSDLVESSKILEEPYLEEGDLAELGTRYLERIGHESSGSQRVVDKMPGNYLYAGLIPLMLPGAKMIHCRRDPLDTCLSCYSMLFGRGHEYSYDLNELGRFYKLYRRLMAHWRRVLPTECLLEVDYEILVADLEGEVRRILDFCSLPWEPGCLLFHETQRRVVTASLDQVRTPIYRSSVGRARAFLPWLEELETAFAGMP